MSKSLNDEEDWRIDKAARRGGIVYCESAQSRLCVFLDFAIVFTASTFLHWHQEYGAPSVHKTFTVCG